MTSTLSIPTDPPPPCPPAPSRRRLAALGRRLAVLALLAATAALYLWGLSASGWANAFYSAVVTGAVFSVMAGIFHGYYLVALAPAIAALVGIGVVTLWRRRDRLSARAVLACLATLTAVWAFVLLRRTPEWHPWLAWLILAVGPLVGLGLLGVQRMRPALATAVATVAVVVGLAGPAGYALATAATPHTGAIPSAGPHDSGLRGAGWAAAGARGSGPSGRSWRPRGAGGALGGLLGSPTPPAAVVRVVGRDATAYTWAAAAVGSNNAAGYQLATGHPVMAIGGFNGTDPSPTLGRFQQLVAQGQVHWFIGAAGPGGTASGGSDTARQIKQWVAANFVPTRVDGVTVYDLSAES